jgi:hypothetical protein
MKKNNDGYEAYSIKECMERIEALEKRILEVKTRVKKDRKRGEFRYWWAVSIPLFVFGIPLLVDATSKTDIILGVLMLWSAGFILAAFGFGLEHRLDSWILSSCSKCKNILKKRYASIHKARATISHRAALLALRIIRKHKGADN